VNDKKHETYKQQTLKDKQAVHIISHQMSPVIKIQAATTNNMPVLKKKRGGWEGRGRG
jgi:hypothetical protein